MPEIARDFDALSPHSQCISLADGFHGECYIVAQHNEELGASEDDIISIPDGLEPEFEKLSEPIRVLSRGYELGIIHE